MNTPKRKSDTNQLAKKIVDLSTDEEKKKVEHWGDPHENLNGKHQKGKNPAAVALGKLGGLKGGKARAESLSPEKRKEIAKKAAAKRWNK